MRLTVVRRQDEQSEPFNRSHGQTQELRLSSVTELGSAQELPQRAFQAEVEPENSETAAYSYRK